MGRRYAVNTIGQSIYSPQASGAYISWGSGLTVFRSDAYSLAITFRPEDLQDTNQVIFSQGNSGNGNLLFEILQSTSDAEKIQVFIRNLEGTTLLNATATSKIKNGWNTLVFTDLAGAARLFLNGVEDATDFSYTPSGTLNFDQAGLCALVQGAGNAAHFKGHVTGFFVWDRELSEDEAYAANYEKAEMGATNVFNFTDGHGATLTDGVGSQNGTVNGSLVWSRLTP